MVEVLSARLGNHVAATRTTPARPARFAAWPSWVLPPLVTALADRGITAPFIHQATAADLAWNGTDVVVATGTSSGKSLAYQLPILSALGTDPRATALYITPTKALEADQLRATTNLIEGADLNILAYTYDGDTDHAARDAIRTSVQFLVTNPDMVHLTLARHARWRHLFSHLRFVVIDECHTYRGVFGSHMAAILWRLQRICALYGASPTFILASATAFDPAGHASRLLGRHVTAVTEDGAPTGERTTILWDPPVIDAELAIKASATVEAANIMALLINEGARTLTFTRSRRSAETVALGAQAAVEELGHPDFARRIAAYRAGYTAEDRRALERQLDDGTLLGVASTNALELGIDVGGLDAVVTAGYPGTIASYTQQAGRAGRRGQGALSVFVARNDPLDQYLIHHPEALLEKPLENFAFNPVNPYVLADHLICAAVEKPLVQAEITALNTGASTGEATAVAQQLVAAGRLRHRPAGYYPAPSEKPHVDVQIRGGLGGEVAIVDVSDGRILGTVDVGRAWRELHPGAVYIHQGQRYLCEELDAGLRDGVALVRPAQPDFTTQVLEETTIAITDVVEEADRGPLTLALAEVDVTTQVTGFIRRHTEAGTLDRLDINAPKLSLHTRAVAYSITPDALTRLGLTEADWPGALHAAEHAAIGMLPILATCDRWDLGGLSTAYHDDTGEPSVFVYDGNPGGAGFADIGYAQFSEWMQMTLDMVVSCTCESGCPSCIISPKCGNGNAPLSKAGAVTVLGLVAS
ncbi:MAG: DEAD/DEAH box helicase [Corynebacterium sp.]|nr:DEAD/DEAH box helicase [Corynebacterium sp.]